MAAATVYCPRHAFVGNGRACPSCDRDRQILELRSRSPLVAPIRGGGRTARRAVDQVDVDGLALFDVARQPVLL